MPFEPFIRLIKDGEAVSAGVTNRPIGGVDRNVQYLYDLIREARIGSTIYARSVLVESAAQVGMPVYYRAATQQFERGLAGAETDLNGTLRMLDSAQIWGVVKRKLSATRADLLLVGYDTIDLTLALDESPVRSGPYYLSSRNAGHLTSLRPGSPIPVLRAAGDGIVFVQPQWLDGLDRHVHYRFSLTCRPAGQAHPPARDARHVITSPDAALSGWLPASHAVFAGRAPANASFGYNLSADPGLKAAWPPLQPRLSGLLWNKGADADVGETAVPLGADGLAILNSDGIWWLSDCYGDVPWPRDLDTDTSDSLSHSVFPPECPRDDLMTMAVAFVQFPFASDTTVVSSLTSADSRLTVRCRRDNSAAVAGDLVLDLDLSAGVVTDSQRGYLALKEADNNGFKRGAVVEGVYARSASVLLSGDASLPVDPLNPAGPRMYQGKVGVEFQAQPTREIDVQLVRVEGVEEEFFRNLMYLGFPAGEQSRYRAKLHVPADLDLVQPKLAIRLRILGRAPGVLPALTVTARRVSRPLFGLTVATILPDDSQEFTVAVATGATLVTATEYVEAESAPFTVAPGDVVFFTVERSATDSYPAELGVIQNTGVLSSGA